MACCWTVVKRECGVTRSQDESKDIDFCHAHSYVTHHIPKKERQVQIEEQRSHFTNVYVKNLPLDVNDDELRTMFGKYGPITSATVAKDEDNLPKGFGFVNFQNHKNARRAVEEMHDTDYFGKKLYVSRAQKKTEREQELRKQYEEARIEKLNKYQGVNLFIKNLDDDIDDERLRQEFSPFGIITSAKVMRDETTNISRGFGFVCFTEADEATRAIAEMNGRMIGSKPIYVGLAQRKDVRRSQLEAQIAQRNMQMVSMILNSKYDFVSNNNILIAAPAASNSKCLCACANVLQWKCRCYGSYTAPTNVCSKQRNGSSSSLAASTAIQPVTTATAISGY